MVVFKRVVVGRKRVEGGDLMSRVRLSLILFCRPERLPRQAAYFFRMNEKVGMPHARAT